MHVITVMIIVPANASLIVLSRSLVCGNEMELRSADSLRQATFWGRSAGGGGLVALRFLADAAGLGVVCSAARGEDGLSVLLPWYTPVSELRLGDTYLFQASTNFSSESTPFRWKNFEKWDLCQSKQDVLNPLDFPSTNLNCMHRSD